MRQHKNRRRSEYYDGDESHHRRKKRMSEKEQDQMIAKYLAKKAEKAAMKLEKKTNMETFVWRKKIERDVLQDLVPLKSSNYFGVKNEKERMAEIEKLQRRKEERARQRAQREEELELVARERAREELQDWEKKEEDFNYKQSMVKTAIRLREGRGKPIDHLVLMSRHLNGAYGYESDEFDQMEMDFNEPWMHAFEGLGVEGLEELRGDIKLNLDHCRRAMPEHNAEFWDALLVVCDSKLDEARRLEHPADRTGLHSSVEADVKAVLDQYGTLEKLKVLQHQIEEKVKGDDKVSEFWEAVLSKLPLLKAKAYLKEKYPKISHKHLHSPKQETVDVEDPMEDDPGSFSPQLFHKDENEQAIDAEEDMALLESKRKAVVQTRNQAAKVKPAPQEDHDLRMKQAAMRAMGENREGDVVFGSNNEVNINPSAQARILYDDGDKYRPRKPKYYNRFHTGFEWNKYNQTHYDHDNPPPKVVMGYKFNIFYPDLIDKTRSPVYYVEEDKGVDNTNNNTCFIRFSAGPPYEDIAFRIVNRDWERSHKKGFKCTFERGILQLYFNFKRYRYRR